jgi:hypothetical protein
MPIATEAVTHDLERARRVSESPSYFRGLAFFDEEGAKCLVLPLLGGAGLDEEAATFAYCIWCADRHVSTVIPSNRSVKHEQGPKRPVAVNGDSCSHNSSSMVVADPIAGTFSTGSSYDH